MTIIRKFFKKESLLAAVEICQRTGDGLIDNSTHEIYLKSSSGCYKVYCTEKDSIVEGTMYVTGGSALYQYFVDWGDSP